MRTASSLLMSAVLSEADCRTNVKNAEWIHRCILLRRMLAARETVLRHALEEVHRHILSQIRENFVDLCEFVRDETQDQEHRLVDAMEILLSEKRALYGLVNLQRQRVFTDSVVAAEESRSRDTLVRQEKIEFLERALCPRARATLASECFEGLMQRLRLFHAFRQFLHDSERFRHNCLVGFVSSWARYALDVKVHANAEAHRHMLRGLERSGVACDESASRAALTREIECISLLRNAEPLCRLHVETRRLQDQLQMTVAHEAACRYAIVERGEATERRLLNNYFHQRTELFQMHAASRKHLVLLFDVQLNGEVHDRAHLEHSERRQRWIMVEDFVTVRRLLISHSIVQRQQRDSLIAFESDERGDVEMEGLQGIHHLQHVHRIDALRCATFFHEREQRRSLRDAEDHQFDLHVSRFAATRLELGHRALLEREEYFHRMDWAFLFKREHHRVVVVEDEQARRRSIMIEQVSELYVLTDNELFSRRETVRNLREKGHLTPRRGQGHDQRYWTPGKILAMEEKRQRVVGEWERSIRIKMSDFLDERLEFLSEGLFERFFLESVDLARSESRSFRFLVADFHTTATEAEMKLEIARQESVQRVNIRRNALWFMDDAFLSYREGHERLLWDQEQRSVCRDIMYDFNIVALLLDHEESRHALEVKLKHAHHVHLESVQEAIIRRHSDELYRHHAKLASELISWYVHFIVKGAKNIGELRVEGVLSEETASRKLLKSYEYWSRCKLELCVEEGDERQQICYDAQRVLRELRAVMDHSEDLCRNEAIQRRDVAIKSTASLAMLQEEMIWCLALLTQREMISNERQQFALMLAMHHESCAEERHRRTMKSKINVILSIESKERGSHAHAQHQEFSIIAEYQLHDAFLLKMSELQVLYRATLWSVILLRRYMIARASICEAEVEEWKSLRIEYDRFRRRIVVREMLKSGCLEQWAETRGVWTAEFAVRRRELFSEVGFGLFYQHARALAKEEDALFASLMVFHHRFVSQHKQQLVFGLKLSDGKQSRHLQRSSPDGEWHSSKEHYYCLRVVDVTPPAASLIQKGEVIIAVNGKSTPSLASFSAALDKISNVARLTVIRRDGTQEIVCVRGEYRLRRRDPFDDVSRSTSPGRF